MPPITRLFVKTALAYFVLALLTGMLITIPLVTAAVPFVGALSPVYYHLFMVGWVTQLIAGVAYWMFPKFTREQPRGYDGLAWATYWLLNIGLVLRVVAEPMQAINPQPWWGWLIVTAAVLQWLGGLSFVANTWPREGEVGVPRLSVLFVRASLVYLAIGLTVGMLLLWNKGVPISPYVWMLLPAHIEFLLIGWIVQLALGVAFWILPRWQTQRGDVRPAWAAFVLLNVGIWCAVLTPWLSLPYWVLSLGRICEAAAAGAFALHAWPRVKPWVEST